MVERGLTNVEISPTRAKMVLTLVKRSRTDVEIGPTRDKMVLTILKKVISRGKQTLLGSKWC